MKSKNLIIFCLVFVLIATSFIGCRKNVVTKVLKVGTSADYPPFESVDQITNEFIGFDLDLMRLLGKKMGYTKVAIMNMDFDTIIPSLNADKIDIAAACITVTPERLEIADAVEYLSTGQSILVKNDNVFDPQLFEDLNGKTVGVQKGTTGEEAIDVAISDNNTLNIIVRRYTSVVLAMMDLSNGSIDAVIIDTPVADYYSAIGDYRTTAEIISENVGLFVRKGNITLLDSLKKAFKEVKGSVEWNSLIEKYFSLSEE